MRSVGQHKLRTVAPKQPPRRIKPGEGRECRIGAAIAIGVRHAREPDPDGSHVRRVPFYVAEIAIETRRISRNVAIAEIAIVPEHIKPPDLMARSGRRQIVLESLHIHFRIWLYVSRAAARKDRLAAGV